ncbi:MAG: hypothetical protein ACE5KH_00350 [Candidatus Geothermarchaeales archaeon]
MSKAFSIWKWDMAEPGRILGMALLFFVSLFAYVGGIRETTLTTTSVASVAANALRFSTFNLYLLATPIIAALTTLSLTSEREKGLLATYMALSVDVKQLLLGKLLAVFTTVFSPLVAGAIAMAFVIDPYAALKDIGAVVSQGLLLAVLGILLMVSFILFLSLASATATTKPLYSFLTPTSSLYLLWYVSQSTPPLRSVLPPGAFTAMMTITPRPPTPQDPMILIDLSGPGFIWLAFSLLAFAIALLIHIRKPDRV